MVRALTFAAFASFAILTRLADASQVDSSHVPQATGLLAAAAKGDLLAVSSYLAQCARVSENTDQVFRWIAESVLGQLPTAASSAAPCPAYAPLHACHD
jgi:hypothetical protein